MEKEGKNACNYQKGYYLECGSRNFERIENRAQNLVTRKDAYLMPNPRGILDKLSGDRIFSTLNCCSAYWTVPLDENDIWKTAFPTPRGHLEILGMPFGLCNSQASYRRVIDKALKNVECTDSYVDDILMLCSEHNFVQMVKSMRSKSLL